MTDEIPSIVKQRPNWKVEFVNFGKAEKPSVRYFNTTIIERYDGDWMVARRAEGFDLTRMGENRLHAFKLDENRKPIAFIPINLASNSYKDQHFEDPRITWVGGKPWLSYCTFQIYPGERYSGAHQQVATLNDAMQLDSRWDPMYGHNGGSILTGTGNEKNWTWFEYDGLPHLIYNIEPHTVVRWDSETLWESRVTPTAPWQYGHIRGGSNPILVGNEYVAFFHSSTPWIDVSIADPKKQLRRRYHMGAYAFEAKPPFRITRITKEPLLSGSQEDPWQPGLPLVVFPCGALLKPQFWLVTMGINDYCTAWVEIPVGDLDKLLQPHKL